MLRHARQRADIAGWYTHAQDAATAGDWQSAAAALESIVQAEPSNRDAVSQLWQARWQQQRASLLDEVRRLHAAQRWQAVIAVGADLAALDPHTHDPDGMISHARQALAGLCLADGYAHGPAQLEQPDRAAGPATIPGAQQEWPIHEDSPTPLGGLRQASDGRAPDQYQRTDHQTGSVGLPPPIRPGAPRTGLPKAATAALPHTESTQPPSTRRWGALIALLAILIILGIGGIWLLKSQGSSDGDTGTEITTPNDSSLEDSDSARTGPDTQTPSRLTPSPADSDSGPTGPDTDTPSSEGPGSGEARLDPGERLNADEWLTSGYRVYIAYMREDGNFVLEGPSGASDPLWASGTAGHPGASIEMQGDGNLVIADAGGVAIWATGTEGHPGSWLTVTNDGHLVINSPTRSLALWSQP
jgi:hypothetical protein